MSEEGSKREERGVVCIFCGTHTPLPRETSRRKRVGDKEVEAARAWVVRCRLCHKEASYLPSDVVEI